MLPLLGIPALVAALTVTQPVQLATCEISTPVANPHMGRDIGTTYDGNYSMRVRFTNTGAQPLTRIVFALNDGRTITDTGTFAPGVTIVHTFDLNPTAANACTVASATYADGMQWAAAPAPAPADAPAANAASFDPDYSHALTVDQQEAAWKAEADRIMQTPSNLGGG
jgi:hypothetical protein